MSGREKFSGRKLVPYERRKIESRKSCAGRKNIPWRYHQEGNQAKMLAHIFYEHMTGASVMEHNREFGNAACLAAIEAATYHIPNFREWFTLHSGGRDPLDIDPKRGIPCGAYLLYQRVYQSFRCIEADDMGSHLCRSKEHYSDRSQMHTLHVWKDWAEKVVMASEIRGVAKGPKITPYASKPKVTTKPLKHSMPERLPGL